MAEVLVRKAALEGERSRLRNELLNGLVQNRNRHIQHQLLTKKAASIPQGMSLKIFLLSNTHYMRHVTKATRDEPILSRRTSNVPGLREYLAGVIAPARLATLEYHVNFRVAVFLKGLELWAYGLRSKSPKQLCTIVARPREKLGEILINYFGDIDIHAQATVANPMKAKLSTLISHATPYINKLRKIHPSTLKRYMSFHGRSEDVLFAEEDWNADLFEPAIDNVMETQWPRLAQKQTHLFSDIQLELEAAVHKIISDLLEEPDLADMLRPKLVDFFKGYIEGMKATFAQHRQEYNDGIA